MRDGFCCPTRIPSLQGALIPPNSQESLVVYHPQVLRRQARQSCPTQQLLLCELIHPG
jgi:hypothetical protein